MARRCSCESPATASCASWMPFPAAWRRSPRCGSKREAIMIRRFGSWTPPPGPRTPEEWLRHGLAYADAAAQRAGIGGAAHTRYIDADDSFIYVYSGGRVRKPKDEWRFVAEKEET